MLEKEDLQAIKEMLSESEERTSARIQALDERTSARIQAAEDRWMAFYESAIQPQLQLLAEGQQTILETLAPKSRVDALEDEVIFLKTVVRTLAQDVAELKKA